MATSESEDFESADEDLGEESKKEVNPVSDEEEGQTSHVAVTSNISVVLDESKSDGEKCVLSSPPTKDLEIAPDTSCTTTNDSSQEKRVGQGSDSAPPESRAERRRNQQKQREPKTKRAPKKLGTKIGEKEMTPLQTPNLLPSNSGNKSEETLVKVDPDSVTCSDEQTLGQDSHAAEIDPYAKFKGYSLPPSIQRCWEVDVDGNPILDDFHQTNEPMKSKDEAVVEPVLDKLSEVASEKANTTWGGWGNWGVSSLLTTATESVSTLTSHVSSVLESGIGAPNPEELARMDHIEQQKIETKDVDEARPEDTSSQVESGGMFNFGQLLTSMSSITKLVETTSSKVLSGGLDTLETIGKKTMEVLQEGDPGLKKKRAMFSETTVLSQVLREAKEKAEKEDKEAEDKQALRNIHFETLFDDYQGLVHLEALEMLSKQCDLKLQSLLLSTNGPALSQLQEKLQQLKDVCQLPDDEEVNDDETDDWWAQLAAAEEALGIPIAADKLHRMWKETQQWLKESASTATTETTEDLETTEYTAKEIHKKAVSTLAQLTATSVEQFHKGAELILIKDSRDPFKEAETLKQITSVLCVQVSTAATHFSERLNNCSEDKTLDSVNSLITNIFLETLCVKPSPDKDWQRHSEELSPSSGC